MNAETMTVGLWVRLEAQSGREADLEVLLRGKAAAQFLTRSRCGPF